MISRPVEVGSSMQYFHVMPAGRKWAENRTALGIGSDATKGRVRRTGAKRTTAKPGASRATPKSKPSNP
jgi:hypothetical protein